MSVTLAASMYRRRDSASSISFRRVMTWNNELRVVHLNSVDNSKIKKKNGKKWTRHFCYQHQQKWHRKKTNGLQMHFRVRTINIKRLQQLISHPLNSFDFCFLSLKPTLQVLKTFHFNSSPIRLLTLDQETFQSLLWFWTNVRQLNHEEN